MRDADLDRILANTEPLVSSPGFTASVVRAARREAAPPAPFRFPWKRALPGGTALVVAVCAGLLLEPPSNAIASQSPALGISAALDVMSSMRAGLMALALLMTLASTELSRRLVRHRL
jgi:hypothetical protein